MNKLITGTTLLFLLTAAGCSNQQRSRNLADERVPAAVTAVQVCGDCHGADGVSVSPNFPRLAGQPKGYLVAQLQNFRSQHRSDPAGYEYMWGLARSLSDQQIDGLATYFSEQSPRPNDAAAPALLSMGKKIFEEGIPDKETPPCSACHGPEAKGLADFPRLADQHRSYLMKQLGVFGQTEQRPGTPMTKIAHSLTRQQIEAVSAYLQGFPQTR